MSQFFFHELAANKLYYASDMDEKGIDILKRLLQIPKIKRESPCYLTLPLHINTVLKILYFSQY